MNTPKEITISRARFDELLEFERELNALHAAGVDNWDFYEEALAEVEGYEENK
jgi:hypothetical protein